VDSENLVGEAKTLISEATKKGVILRVFGGVAIRSHCPSAAQSPLTRRLADIDLFGLSKQSTAIQMVFADLSYLPARSFNALHGNKRMMFFEPKSQVRRDVFLDWFVMCHKFDFRKRLDIDTFSIPLADLLMTKLQVVEIEERDFKDIICIILDHELANSDVEETINQKYIADICSNDWGIYTTFAHNLVKAQTYLQGLELENSKKALVEAKMQTFAKAIEQAPKSMKWKSRSLVGEKMPWYELPEVPKTIRFE
jgi:hypothetical protein